MNILKLVALAAIAFVTFGCSPQSNTNAGTGNGTKAAINTNQPSPTPSPSIESGGEVGSLATPADAYRTAYALREKKDIQGLKRVLSKDVLEFLEMIGEDEKKTLDDEIKAMFDRPQAKTNETRNVKVSGDRATLEYLNEKGEWKTMDFVKEGNDWKMSLPGKDDIKVESGPTDKRPQ